MRMDFNAGTDWTASQGLVGKFKEATEIFFELPR